MFLSSDEIKMETQAIWRKLKKMRIMTLKMNALDWNTETSTRISKDQIRYIRSIFADRGVTVKQIQLEYDISYSVLNRIKISALNLQDKWKVRNIAKIYEDQKKILIK